MWPSSVGGCDGRRQKQRTGAASARRRGPILPSTQVGPFEGDAEPSLLAPDNPATPRYLIRLNEQLEFVGDAKAGWNVKGGAGIRYVSDCATESTALEFDHRAFEDSTPGSLTVFGHVFAPPPFLSSNRTNLLSGHYEARLRFTVWWVIWRRESDRQCRLISDVKPILFGQEGHTALDAPGPRRGGICTENGDVFRLAGEVRASEIVGDGIAHGPAMMRPTQ